jgi:hypothetical protein
MSPHDVTIACPVCSSDISINNGKRVASDVRPAADVTSHSHWLPLHRYAVENKDNWDPEQAAKDYAEWCLGIPSYNCSCQAHWEAYTSTSPPDFRSPERFFTWGVEAHNYVSEHHAQNPTITLDDAWASWWGVAPLRRRRLVITVATGREFARLLQITRPALEAYAERCGADFVALVNETEAWWGFEKFRVRKFVEQYEQTLFIDADAIPQADCPDIFQLVPRGSVGIHDDWPELGVYTDWLVGDRRQVYASQGVVGQVDRPVCFNSGVVVCCPATADIWTRPSDELPRDHTSEQTWVEYQCLRHDVTLLPRRFNTQWWMPRFREYLPEAHVVHLANCKTRLEEARRFVPCAE